MNDDASCRSRRAVIGSIALGIIGGLAGCVGGGGQRNNGQTSTTTTTSSRTTTTESPASPSPSPTTSRTTTSNPTTTTSLSTPTEPWTPPTPPRQPTQDKDEDRITDGEFINTVEAPDGSGYTDFDLRVGANTWMKNVDPPKNEDGEAYFIVEINGQIVARTDIVPFRKEGSFTIPIPAAALQQFDSGTLDIRVSLFDEDHSRADRYGTWTTTIEYTATKTA